MTKLLRIGLTILALAWVCFAQSSSGWRNRRYQPGERLHYLMKARDSGREYQIRWTAVVKLANGQFVEEYACSDFIVDGVPRPLTPASREFRQVMTLAATAETPFKFPDLSKVQPGLIGPITDLLTFYADLFLATREGELRNPGDRFFFQNAGASSWADGTRVLIGEDAIDFDVHLTGVDTSRGEAMLLVKHVPPKTAKVKAPTNWMREPVAGTPNNWVQVRRTNDGYAAAAGKETFDVELKVSLSTGEILSAVMDNVVDAVGRDCKDAALADCGQPRPQRIVRRIEMSQASP